MKEATALLAMTTIARRSSAWAADIVTASPINKGEVSEDSIRRYRNDILEALAFLDERVSK